MGDLYYRVSTTDSNGNACQEVLDMWSLLDRYPMFDDYRTAINDGKFHCSIIVANEQTVIEAVLDGIITPVKTCIFDQTTGDYCLRLNGQFVGYAPTEQAGKHRLDALAYQMLARGNRN